MIGVILTGHGQIADGFVSGAKLVFGELENCAAVNFTFDITPEQLEKDLEENINKLNTGEGVLILTDILGGTPFRTASLLSIKHENVKVISGVNFPLLLEVLSEREDSKLIDLYNLAIETGKAQLQGFELENSNDNSDEFSEDGI